MDDSPDHSAMTPDAAAETLARLRARALLVHSMTSPVAANFTANALLALGCAPAMVESPAEVAGFAAAADALVVNLGMLTPARAEAMLLAVDAAAQAGRPWVLDPVGAGGIPARTAFALILARRGPAAIRGNASEIRSLAGLAGGGRGVDTGAASDDAIAAAADLARGSGAVVAVSGAVDYVTDGRALAAIGNGDVMMTRVTAMGCAASAIVAACLGAGGDRLAAVAHAMAITGLAGERAASGAAGPGSLAVAYLDQLSLLDGAALRQGARIGVLDLPR